MAQKQKPRSDLALGVWTMQLAEAERLFSGIAAGNAVVVRDEFMKRGVRVSLRTVQRAVAGKRRELLAAGAATVR